ncbi:hypothetical protein [Burkholderia gladioli]|uniref:hypothetical protein n=1 Tax=Burkholderia gladioli TaxID=28095 RepID=UPI003EDFCA39
MTDSATIQPKPTDVFVSPLSDFHPVDIDANLKDLNKWLIDISGGLVTLSAWRRWRATCPSSRTSSRPWT